MYIFASIVHNLRTNNVNVYVSKIYPRGLIFGMLLGLNNLFFFFGGGGGIFEEAYIQRAY